MPVSPPVARPRIGRGGRWAIGLTVATVLALSAIAALGTGIVVAAAREWNGVNLTGRATATVVEVRRHEVYDDLGVRFTAGGSETAATVPWHAGDPPSPGDRITVAYDPRRPEHARPEADVDPGDWSAGWHPEPWILTGVGLLHLGTGAVAITAILALRAPPRAPRRRGAP
jgi:hypothetical protein